MLTQSNRMVMWKINVSHLVKNVWEIEKEKNGKYGNIRLKSMSNFF